MAPAARWMDDLDEAAASAVGEPEGNAWNAGPWTSWKCGHCGQTTWSGKKRCTKYGPKLDLTGYGTIEVHFSSNFLWRNAQSFAEEANAHNYKIAADVRA